MGQRVRVYDKKGPLTLKQVAEVERDLAAGGVVIEIAQADVIRTSRTLLEAEEQVERLTNMLAEAKDEAKWAKVNHRAAMCALRTKEGRRP